MRRRRARAPDPSVAEPRPVLLAAVLAFVRAARRCNGVRRIALLGSLTTPKPVLKDADLLITIESGSDLGPLARAGRRLKGSTQSINLGADIFLADETGAYLGRICHYRTCHPRAACRAGNCGKRDHLNDDLQIITLAPALIARPPVELWPCILRRQAMPRDVEEQLLAKLAENTGPAATF